MTTITLPSMNIGDCVCRSRRHRLQAKKQARAFVQDWLRTPTENSDVRTTAENWELTPPQIRLLKDKKVCPRCTSIYLQLLEDPRGEQIAEYAISFLCPLV